MYSSLLWSCILVLYIDDSIIVKLGWWIINSEISLNDFHFSCCAIGLPRVSLPFKVVCVLVCSSRLHSNPSKDTDNSIGDQRRKPRIMLNWSLAIQFISRHSLRQFLEYPSFVNQIWFHALNPSFTTHNWIKNPQKYIICFQNLPCFDIFSFLFIFFNLLQPMKICCSSSSSSSTFHLFKTHENCCSFKV